MAARVTQVVVEVLRQGPAAARVTQVAVEVLRSVANASPAGTAEATAAANQGNRDPVRRPARVVPY